MCDDFFEDFDDEMDGCFDEDNFEEDGFGDDETDEKDSPDESTDDFWDGPDWQDWMIIGPLSEDIAREKRDIDRIRKKNDDYWETVKRRW